MGPGFVFTNHKIVDLEAIDTGTRVTHKETFSGMMAVLMGGKIMTGVPPILTSFNEGLKKQAEH